MVLLHRQKRLASVPRLDATSMALYLATSAAEKSGDPAPYVCVAGLKGLTVIDVSDPRQPRVASTYASDTVEGVRVAGSSAYIAEGYRGLTVLDLSDPTRLRKVSASDLQYASKVDTVGDYAFVADPGGLSVVQVLIPDWVTEARH